MLWRFLLLLLATASVAYPGGPLRPSFALASSAALYGVSARYRSMGDAQVAIAAGADAPSSNPAGLAGPQRPRLGIDLQHGTHRLRLDGEEIEMADHVALGVGLSIPFRAAGLRWGLGLALEMPDRAMSTWQWGPPMERRVFLYDGWARRGSLRLGAAVGWPGLRIGAGLSVLAAAEMETGSMVSRQTDQSESRVSLRANPEVTPMLGLQWELGPVHLGLSYLGRIRSTLVRRSGAKVESAGGEGAALTYTSKLHAHDIPWRLTAGLGWQPLPILRVAADLEYSRWSAIGSPLTPSSAGELTWGETTTPYSSPEQTEPRFGDTLSARVGAEIDLRLAPSLTLSLRGGYRYDPSPVPHQVGLTNLLDAPRDTICAGLGARLARLDPWLLGELSVDLSFRLIVLRPAGLRKTHPALAQFDTSLDGSVRSLGLTGTLRF